MRVNFFEIVRPVVAIDSASALPLSFSGSVKYCCRSL